MYCLSSTLAFPLESTDRRPTDRPSLRSFNAAAATQPETEEEGALNDVGAAKLTVELL